MKVRKRRSQVRRKRLQDDGDHLEAQLTLCFLMLEKTSVKDIAEMAGISKSSVYNLRRNGSNVNRRYNTVNRLAKAAGLSFSVTDGSVSLTNMRKK